MKLVGAIKTRTDAAGNAGTLSAICRTALLETSNLVTSVTFTMPRHDGRDATYLATVAYASNMIASVTRPCAVKRRTLFFPSKSKTKPTANLSILGRTPQRHC